MVTIMTGLGCESQKDQMLTGWGYHIGRIPPPQGKIGGTRTSAPAARAASCISIADVAGPTLSYMDGDELNASCINDGKASDQHSKSKTDRGRHAPSPSEPSCGQELRPFHREGHNGHGQRRALEYHHHAIDRKERR
jgi:hypothetical protein